MSDHHQMQGFPRVREVAVGQAVEAKIGESWLAAVVTWLGHHVVYVKAADGGSYKVDRYTSHLRVPEAA